MTTLTASLQDRIGPVRWRQRWQVSAQSAVNGLLVGCLIGLCLAVARIQGGVVSSLAIVITAAVGLLVGFLQGWLLRPTWQQSARAIDQRYRLKDRTRTALEFAAAPQATDLEVLQVCDALDHLQDIRAGDVIPHEVPRLLPWAALAALAVVGLACWPLSGESPTATAASREHIVTVAEGLESTLVRELEELAGELAEKDGDKTATDELDSDQAALEELAAAIQTLVKEMQGQAVDTREALAKLSEMQAAIASAQAEFDLDAVAANLRAVGEAISSAAALQAAAEAIQAEDYRSAADKLDQLELAEISEIEAETVARQLEQASRQIAETGADQLHQSTEKLAQGLRSGDHESTKRAAQQMAKSARQFALRKQISSSLGRQLTLLTESKGNFVQSGGQARNQQQQPSDTWGRGTSGDLYGAEASRVDANLRREEITGTAGEGPSERELSYSPKAREAAQRPQQQVYQEFRKQAEQVLEGEDLPLGHRRTIRTYFELIRPENANDPVPEPQ